MDWNLVRTVLFGTILPLRVRVAVAEVLFHLGLTMGTLFIGRHGSGKTSTLARHLVEQFDTYPEESIFVLEWSGDISNKILTQIAQRPREEREQACHRIVYDELGHPDWVLPLPEFSLAYGGIYEDEIQRVRSNLDGLFGNLSEGDARILVGVAINKILPEVFRLITALRDPYGHSWQVTEVDKLIDNPKLLKAALAMAGNQLSEATREFIKTRVVEITPRETELRTYVLSELFDGIQTPYMQAKFGYYKPSWSPKEAVERGQMVIVNGARLNNQPKARDYAFTQAYSLIKAEANRRAPADPRNKRMSLVLDETKNLLKIPAFAQEIGEIAPVFRSRCVQLYIVIQALSQLSEELENNIWLLGNIVCFGLENKADAEKMAYQLAPYNPRKEKQPAKTNSQNPVTEPVKGQDREGADWINSFKKRELIIKRYISEDERDPDLSYVPKTQDLPSGPLQISLDALKEQLLRARGVPVPQALDVVKQRELRRVVGL